MSRLQLKCDRRQDLLCVMDVEKKSFVCTVKKKRELPSLGQQKKRITLAIYSLKLEVKNFSKLRDENCILVG